MRLIDADEITEVLERMEESGVKDVTLEAAIEIIDDAPTIEMYKNLTENKAYLRPCIADGKKARFHRWSGHSEIIEGGVMQWTAAIVEYEGGQIGVVMPCDIRFTDTESEAEKCRT